MTHPTVIDFDGIGPIVFERSRRARHLSISLRPFRGIRVAIPYSVTQKEAEEFARSKVQWIRAQISRIDQLEREYEATLQNPAHIRRATAKQELIKRLNQLAAQHGFTYNRVFIRNQKSRWGSCSIKNNVNLNMKLVQLPDELIDYVILHELVHTKIKNHGKTFWNELNRLLGNAKSLDAQLKRYGPGLLR